MISAKSSGSFDKTVSFLRKMYSGKIFNILEKYGQIGVDLLSSATPKDTGLAAHSWMYQLGYQNGIYSISWLTTDIENGFNVIIGIQYGHGTGTGGWVEGRDFINPAMRPLFDKIANDVWMEVRNA